MVYGLLNKVNPRYNGSRGVEKNIYHSLLAGNSSSTSDAPWYYSLNLQFYVRSVLFRLKIQFKNSSQEWNPCITWEPLVASSNTIGLNILMQNLGMAILYLQNNFTVRLHMR